MSKRIRVFYEDKVLDGTVFYETGDSDSRLGIERGVIFDNGETDTITDYNDYKILN